MKVVSIKEEGVIEHINRYFKQQGLDFTYSDVIRLKHMKIGKRALSMRQQADELGGMSRNTLYAWHRYINSLDQ